MIQKIIAFLTKLLFSSEVNERVKDQLLEFLIELRTAPKPQVVDGIEINDDFVHTLQFIAIRSGRVATVKYILSRKDFTGGPSEAATLVRQLADSESDEWIEKNRKIIPNEQGVPMEYCDDLPNGYFLLQRAPSDGVEVVRVIDSEVWLNGGRCEKLKWVKETYPNGKLLGMTLPKSLY